MSDTKSATLSTSRLIAADVSQVFAAFERPELLCRWWGPKGFSCTFQQFEFKPGGKWVFVMHGPNGEQYPNETVFREIQPNAKVVMEHVVAPWFLATITLTAQGEKTLVRFDQQFETAEFAEKMRPLCEPANEQNMDKLEALVTKKS